MTELEPREPEFVDPQPLEGVPEKESGDDDADRDASRPGAGPLPPDRGADGTPEVDPPATV